MSDQPKAGLEHLVLYASAVCNAHCTMCDVGRAAEVGISRALAGTPAFMPLPLLEKVLDDPLVADRRPRMNTYFIMTEPLLAPELPAMLQAARRRGHPAYLTTNGRLLERRAAEIAPLVDSIQVSLDGPEAVHDAIRGPGFFSAALAGLKAFRGRNAAAEVVVNCTVFGRTAPHLVELARTLDGLGVRIDLLKFQGLDFVSREMRERHNAACPDIVQTASTEGEAVDFAALDFAALAGQLQELRKMRPANIVRLGFKPPFATEEELRAYYHADGAPMPAWSRCVTPWVAMAVNTAGKAFFHTRCFNDYVLGDAWTQPLADIFHGGRANRLRALLARSGYCLPACARCCGVNPLEKIEAGSAREVRSA